MSGEVEEHLSVQITPEQMPATIEVGELELDAINGIFEDVKVAISKLQQSQMAMQQLQQASQMAQAEYSGGIKAAEVFIRTVVKTHGYVGIYVYDPDKKILVRQDTVQQLGAPPKLR
jgi:hypothetical protein